MPEVIEGIIRGKMIELASDPGLAEGQAVQVVVKPLVTLDQRRQALLRTAGSMVDDPEFEAVMRQLESERRSACYREPNG